MKRCSRCKVEKRRNQFGKNRSMAEGLDCYCTPCRREERNAWGAAHVEQESARKRRWDREGAEPCVDCGAALSGRRATRCVECTQAGWAASARERTERWLLLRRQGLDNIEIARCEGTTAAAVAQTLCRRRVARFPDLEWLPAPYAAARGVAA